MLLSQTAEYALRALTCLARRSPDGATAAELAGEASIPGHYVSKVLRQLVVAGLVSARRGRGGGFRLARPAASVRFCDVFEAVGGVHDPDRCAFGHLTCNAETPCPLHDAWVDLQQRFDVWARETTLEDARTGRAESP